MILFFLRYLNYFYFIQPRKIQLFWGSALGFVLRMIRLRASTVCANLALVFPDDKAKQKQIFQASYAHLGTLIFEILLVLGGMKKFVAKYVDFTGLEHLKKAQAEGRGVIFLASHLGNWEIMAAVGGVLAEANLLLVTKHLRPEWMHEAIEKGRAQYNVLATYEPKTVKAILSHLKKNGTVGIVLDQYAGAPIGVRVPFLGIPVGTSLGLATLVKRTGAIVLPVENYREPNGRWRVSVHPPLGWIQGPKVSLQHELALNTACYINWIEKRILAHPDQWLWTHKRFKGDLSPLREGEWDQIRARH